MESPDSARHCAKDLTSDALAELLGNRDDLLILDCRSFIAFNKSHIAGAANVTCPTLLLKRLQQRSKKRRQSHSGRSQCVVLEKLVASQHELRVLCSTGQVSTVVLYGDVGEEPLNSLLVLLTGDVAHLYYLSDGFEAFANAYPELCVAEEQPVVEHRHSPAPPPSALLHKENMMLEPTMILPYLYLGNKRNAADADTLIALRITHVLNVAKEIENADVMEELSLQYKYLPMVDTTEQDIQQYLEEAFGFIEDARQASGKVLVHCVGGISRSVAVTLAYLMRTQALSLDSAYAFMKERKANISPNISFMGQLLEFEKAEQERRALLHQSDTMCE